HITAKSIFEPKFGYKVLSTCGNVRVQFIDSSSSCDPANNIDYAWLTDEGDFADKNNPIVTFSTGGSHDIEYVAQDDNFNSVDSIVTIILPNPTPGPSPVTLNDTTICAGNSVQLDAGSEPGATYVWTPATGLSSTSIYNPVATPTSTQ